MRNKTKKQSKADFDKITIKSVQRKGKILKDLSGSGQFDSMIKKINQEK